MRGVWLVGLAFVAQGCVLGPTSNSVLEAGVSTVFFDGVTDQNVTVIVEVLQPRTGTYVVLGSGSSVAGSFHVTVTVPESAFFTPPCNFATFRVRDSLGRQYAGRDQACLDDPRQSSNICGASVILLQRPQTLQGPLALNGQSDADTYACVTTLDGDLSIAAGEATGAQNNTYLPGVSFSLPRLKEVTGSLSIAGQGSELVNLPQLTQVGGDMSMALNGRRFDANNGNTKFVNKVNAPKLVSIGGNLVIDAASLNFSGGGATPTMDVGLPALTSIGNGLTINNPAPPNLHMSGLTALTNLPGNLTFNWTQTDLVENGLLPALVSVGGNADITMPPNARQLFPALTTVSGNVTIQNAASVFQPDPSLLPVLQAVGGSFTLQNARTSCTPSGNRFPALKTVSGAVSILGANSEFRPFMGANGANALTVGSLDVSGTKTQLIPFGSDMQVVGAGAVNFQNNANLCPCRITSFTSGLVANGWSGASTGTGNGTAMVCSPCPAPPVCP
jgi:hypothetical protein